MDRAITTLFMLISVDGKISTGSLDNLDFDRDLPKIDGVRQGLHQYYEIEQTTDLWSLNSGRVQAKIGVNDAYSPPKSEVSFVLIDNKNLTKDGVEYFCQKSKEFVLVTTNYNHPAFFVHQSNLHIILQNTLNLRELLTKLKKDFNCDYITIQTGGTLNGLFLREKLIDYVDIVVAPILIGGSDVSTLIDGKSIFKKSEFDKLGVLKLEDVSILEDSYLRLRYKVLNGEEDEGNEISDELVAVLIGAIAAYEGTTDFKIRTITKIN